MPVEKIFNIKRSCALHTTYGRDSRVTKYRTPEKININIFTNDIDEKAEEQLKNIGALPIIASDIAVMPDVHWGNGATIGSVIPTANAIIPAAVGVDIGCGMMAVKLSLTAVDLPDDLKNIRASIESAIPVGFEMHKTINDFIKYFVWERMGLSKIYEKAPPVVLKRKSENFWWKQVGTLGGGNHFIEICLDEKDCVWLMLHSGSRGIGHSIADYYITQAKLHAEKAGFDKRFVESGVAWLEHGNPLFDDYRNALYFAQQYAKFNRETMMKSAFYAIKKHFKKEVSMVMKAINCHHNYVADHIISEEGDSIYITRKGAISALKGELGIIPGSMGTKSFIVEGLGNPKSLYSCSHGAGRRISRSEARKRFTVEELEKQTEGVECRKDKKVIDEIPAAYKDIDKVMENQRDLVKIVATLKQIVCIKG